MSTKRTRIFSIGDRVAERPKTHGLVAVRTEVRERIKQYRNQRYGTVVGFSAKKIRTGGHQKFLLVKWDHLQSPSEHARARICHLDEFPKLMNEACAVLGE